MTMTTTPLAVHDSKFGRTEVLGFESSRYHVRRVSRYVPADGRRPIIERHFAASRDDLTPNHSAYPTGYDSRCGFCYLGAAHTAAAHDSRLDESEGKASR